MGTQLSPQKGGTHPPNFRPMSIVAKRSPISATAELLYFLLTVYVFWVFVIFIVNKFYACPVIQRVCKGTDETAPLIGHFCRASANETLPTVVLPGSNAWVRMVLVPRFPISGFQMRYSRSGLWIFFHYSMTN